MRPDVEEAATSSGSRRLASAVPSATLAASPTTLQSVVAPRARVAPPRFGYAATTTPITPAPQRHLQLADRRSRRRPQARSARRPRPPWRHGGRLQRLDQVVGAGEPPTAHAQQYVAGQQPRPPRLARASRSTSITAAASSAIAAPQAQGGRQVSPRAPARPSRRVPAGGRRTWRMQRRWTANAIRGGTTTMLFLRPAHGERPAGSCPRRAAGRPGSHPQWSAPRPHAVQIGGGGRAARTMPQAAAGRPADGRWRTRSRPRAALRVAAGRAARRHSRDLDALRVGEIVFAIGHPLGQPHAGGLGIVRAATPAQPIGQRGDGEPTMPGAIQADLRLYPGNSWWAAGQCPWAGRGDQQHGGPTADGVGRPQRCRAPARRPPAGRTPRRAGAHGYLPPPLVERLQLPTSRAVMWSTMCTPTRRQGGRGCCPGQCIVERGRSVAHQRRRPGPDAARRPPWAPRRPRTAGRRACACACCAGAPSAQWRWRYGARGDRRRRRGRVPDDSGGATRAARGDDGLQRGRRGAASVAEGAALANSLEPEIVLLRRAGRIQRPRGADKLGRAPARPWPGRAARLEACAGSGICRDSPGADWATRLGKRRAGRRSYRRARAVASGLVVLAPRAVPSPARPRPLAHRSAAHGGAHGARGGGPGALAQGLPNKAIALRLAISEHTVQFHVGRSSASWAPPAGTEAVMLAARQGLLML